MRKHGHMLSLLRRAGLSALALIVIGFFGASAVLGPNGMFAYTEYHRQIPERAARFNAVDKQRAELRNRVELLDPKRANADLVDELVRKELNVAHPDEVIIPNR